jgi:hypothetical protein
MDQISTSPGWIERILLVLGGLLTGITASLPHFIGWLKDKKKTEAEAEGIRIGNAIKGSEQIWALALRLNQLEASMDERNRDNQRQQEFLRSEIRYHEELEACSRNRMHELAGELGKLVLHIKNTEQFISTQTTLKAPTITIRTFDEIVAAYPLPAVPDNNKKNA